MVWPPPWPGGGDAGVSSSGGAPPNKCCRVGVRATRVVGRNAVAYAASTASAKRAMASVAARRRESLCSESLLCASELRPLSRRKEMCAVARSLQRSPCEHRTGNELPYRALLLGDVLHLQAERWARRLGPRAARQSAENVGDDCSGQNTRT